MSNFINIANTNEEELKVQLKAYARDNLGLTLQSQMRVDTMIQKIKEQFSKRNIKGD